MCGLASVPERIPPYNCLLEDPSAGKSVGVLLDGGSFALDDRIVVVVGVVKKVYTGPLIKRLVYYIAAEKVQTTD